MYRNTSSQQRYQQIYYWINFKKLINMDPSEVEFLAEKEKVTILPNFSENKVYLIGVGLLID